MGVSEESDTPCQECQVAKSKHEPKSLNWGDVPPVAFMECSNKTARAKY